MEHLYTKKQAAQLRQKLMDEYVVPIVKICFRRHSQLRSAALLVAQYWNDNGEVIPAFAAFCREGAHQEMSIAEAYAPYAILRRCGDDIAIEIVGQMLRPWLDGIHPE